MLSFEKLNSLVSVRPFEVYTSEVRPKAHVHAEKKELGLNEVDGDFYSGVNVTDDAASRVRPQNYSLFRGGVADPYLVAHLRGQHSLGSARAPRKYTRARLSGRHRKPACAHGCERKEAPKLK